MLPDIKPALKSKEYNNGYRVFGDISSKKVILISHGKIFHTCLKIFKNNKKNIACVDLFRSKPFPEKLIKKLKKVKKILVVDEQTPSGNLGSCVYESLSSKKIFPKIITKSLNDEYVFENGGRSYLIEKYGLSESEILNTMNSF